MRNIAYIALGTNIGKRDQHLHQAISFLKEEQNIKLVMTSSVYETDPVGYTDQDPFFNMVIKVETTLLPLELLAICQKIEQKLGRRREIRWGPRTIDLDILLYNKENIESENLIVPHPRMTERGFVLIPLLEISPNINFPDTAQPLKSYLDNLPDKEGVRIWRRKNGEDVFAPFAN